MLGSSVRIVSANNKNSKQFDQEPKATSVEIWRRLVPFSLVYLAACTLFFYKLGAYPLFNPDEALYAEPAREMLEIGDYVTTYLNYVVRFTKPPIAIWGQAASILAFGCNEFAVRFFGASAAALLVAATYGFTERLLNRRAAIVSAITLATAPLFIGTARVSITDMPLSLFSAGSMLCFFLAYHLNRKSWLWAAYALTGLAVMTKGPVGLVLPVAILGVFHFLRQELKEAWKFYSPGVGMAIVGLISLPWFVLEIYITKGAYFNDFIVRENFQRYTSVVDSHKGAWWYHPAAVMGGFFPWSAFLPQAMFAALRFDKIKLFWKNSGPLSILQSFKNLSLPETLALYCLTWIVVTTGFFSTSVSKLLPYTLPCFPALAIITALEFERILAKQDWKRAIFPSAVIALVFGGATLVLPHTVKLLRDAPSTLLDILISFVSYELIFSCATLALLSRRFFRSAFMVFLIPTIFGFLFFGNNILSVLSQTWEKALPDMARYAAVSKLPILVYDMRKPSIPFYTRRQVTQPSSAEQLKEILDRSREGAYIMTKSKQSQFFRSLPGCKIIHAEGKFILVLYKPDLNAKEGGA